MARGSARRARIASAMALVLLLHAGVAVFLDLSVAPLRAPWAPLRDPTDVNLSLAPPVRDTEPAPRARQATPPSPPSRKPDRTAPARTSPPHPVNVPAQPPIAQGPAQPSVAPAVAAGAASGPAGDAVAEGVRRALRGATGCASQGVVQMGEADREACRRSFARDAALGARQWVDPISNVRKRAYYDEVRDAYANIRDYNPVNGPMGGRPLSAGCGAKGCKVILPRGFLTEEAGIEKP